MTWQPIETAPRDQMILGWNGVDVDIWVWDSQTFHKRPRPHWRTRRSISTIVDRRMPPTHWQPLPAPPEPGA